jgi:phosphoglycerate-specific signal transduction histidine kinase
LVFESCRTPERRRRADHTVVRDQRRCGRAKTSGGSLTGNPCKTGARIATVAELSASIAHELNQPLTAVIANAQAAWRWLSNNPPNFSEAMTSIERVRCAGRVADKRMQHIRALFNSNRSGRSTRGRRRSSAKRYDLFMKTGREMKFPLMYKLRLIFRQS